MSLKNPLIIFFSLIFLGLYFIFVPTEKSYSKICFENNCFNIEIAETEKERREGLMYREKLPEGKGMFFDFKKKGIHSIWMKNTLITLDIIWLNQDLEVVHVEQNVSPCIKDPCPVYRNKTPARFVLEVNRGAADFLNSKETGVLYK